VPENELRQDRVSGEWAVIAPARSKRPRKVPLLKPREALATSDADCPFCHGNEAELLSITAEYPSAEPPGWSVRAILNKYAAFTSDAPPAAPAGTQIAHPAFGYQEVIVETPDHQLGLWALADDQIATVIRAYRDRFKALAEREGVNAVILFRNYGPGSGASLPHAHSQLAATALHAPRLKALEERAREHHDLHQSCIVCADLAEEQTASSRIVDENESFVTHTPYAAHYPFELWITPRRHQARFDEIEDREIGWFGHTLRGALRRLRQLHGDFSYNFAIDSAPVDAMGAPHLHWRLHLVPRLADWAGFELGTGVFVNPSSPEEDAVALRGAAIP
jgi:UDPglucose--hexose-1-phosphate uridylyltransferase